VAGTEVLETETHLLLRMSANEARDFIGFLNFID